MQENLGIIQRREQYLHLNNFLHLHFKQITFFLQIKSLQEHKKGASYEGIGITYVRLFLSITKLQFYVCFSYNILHIYKWIKEYNIYIHTLLYIQESQKFTYLLYRTMSGRHM